MSSPSGSAGAGKRKISVLFCGQIRKPEYVIRSIELLDGCLRDGVVDEVLFALWDKEIERYPVVRDLAVRIGVTFIEISSQPDAYSPHNTFHQSTHIQAGLDAARRGNHVYKTRYDMAFNATAGFRRHLEDLQRIDLRIEDAEDRRIFEEKVWVGQVVTRLIPFWYYDRFLFGRPADLRKLASFSSAYEFLMHPAGTINEVRVFSGPFVETYPIIRNIFRVNWLKYVHLVWGHVLTEPEVVALQSKYEFFWLAQALNFMVIDTFFVAGVRDMRPEEYTSLRTPMRTDGHELPSLRRDARDIYRDCLQDERFLRALDRVRDPAFHAEYRIHHDAEFEAMAAELPSIAEFPFPILSVRTHAAQPLPLAHSDRWGGGPADLEPVRNYPTATNCPLTLHLYAQAKSKPGAEFVVEALMRNTGSLPLDWAAGHDIVLNYLWLDREGAAISDPLIGFVVQATIVRFHRVWFRVCCPDASLDCTLEVSLHPGGAPQPVTAAHRRIEIDHG